MTTRFEKHARTVSLLTLASRMTGLVRDAALSRVFGAGGLADAFFFAFMIPNLFRRLFGEGALAAAFLPVYTRLDRDDPETARRLASLTISVLVVGLGAITLAGEVVLFAISHQAGHGNLAVRLMMITLPYMPLVCVVAILGAMLQVRGRFGPTASAPIILNGCLIAAAVGLAFWLERDPASPGYEHARVVHIAIVAGSVVLAGVLQVAWSLAALPERRWWTRDTAAARGPLGQVLRQAGPMILGLGVLQLNTLLDGVIASYPGVIGPKILGVDYPLAEGAMSAVSFAQRLYQFPLGVFGIAVATAIFPALARLAHDPEGADGFADTMRRGLRLVVFIGVPASCGLVLVREPLVAVVLQGGDFTRSDTTRVAFVLLGYAPAIWAYSMVHVLTRAFYARGEPGTPVKVAAAMVLLNLTLNCTLIWTPLREAGLAWSTAACSILQSLLLVMILRRRVGAIVDRTVVLGWTRTIACAAIMTAAVLAAAALTRAAAPDRPWLGSLGTLAALVATGAVAYVGAAAALRAPELRWAISGR